MPAFRRNDASWVGLGRRVIGGNSMQLGMIGLGRMGGNIVRRLLRGGHSCAAYDRSAEAVAAIAREGAVPARSVADLVAQLTPPRAVWVMLPAGAAPQAAREGAARPLRARGTRHAGRD